MNFNIKDGINNLVLLNKKSELEIISYLENYKTIIEQCNENYEVHPICFYLRDLASKFHSYYNSEIIIDVEEDKRNAKFALLLAVKKTIKSGMDVLMIETPEKNVVINIEENISILNEKIKKKTSIIAVSKKKSAELVEQAYLLGIKNFGENYLQEALTENSLFKSLGY